MLGRHGPGSAGESEDEVSLVVAGSALRGRAVLTVARPRAPSGRPVDGAALASPHLPRSLPPPEDRRARRGEVTIRLREQPGRGTFDDVLAESGGVTAGEAVTVLAAVARGLSDLHGAGRGGVGLTPADIGFRHDGCPMLTAVDRLVRLDQRTMAEDVAAFAALAGTICRAVVGGHGVTVLGAAIDSGHGSWEDVVAGVLRAADPTAVRPVTPRDGVTGTPAVSSVARRDRVADAGSPPSPSAPPRDRRPSDLVGAMERLLDGLADRPISRGLAVARSWIAARPVLAVVAGTPPAAAALLLVVLPDSSGT